MTAQNATQNGPQAQAAFCELRWLINTALQEDLVECADLAHEWAAAELLYVDFFLDNAFGTRHIQKNEWNIWDAIRSLRGIALPLLVARIRLAHSNLVTMGADRGGAMETVLCLAEKAAGKEKFVHRWYAATVATRILAKIGPAITKRWFRKELQKRAQSNFTPEPVVAPTQFQVAFAQAVVEKRHSRGKVVLLVAGSFSPAVSA